MDLNVFGLNTVLNGGTESLPNVDNFEDLQAGTEAKTEEDLVVDIKELINTNETLDKQMHTGLTSGVESISETFKMIQLADAIHALDNVDSESEYQNMDMGGLESVLQYAGIALSELVDYSAGIEAQDNSNGNKPSKEGMRNKIANSFVGKAAGKLANTITRLWNWIKEFVFGKKSKAIDVSVAKVIVSQKKKYSEILAASMKEKDAAIADLASQLKEMTDAKKQEQKKSMSQRLIIKGLEQNKAELKNEIRGLQYDKETAIRNLDKTQNMYNKERLEKDRLETLIEDSGSYKDLKRKNLEFSMLVKKLETEKSELNAYIKKLEAELTKGGEIIDEYIEKFAELAAKNDATKKVMEKYGVIKEMDKFVSSIHGKVVGTQFEFHKSISSILSSMGYCSKEITNTAKILGNSKPNLKTSRVPGVLSETFNINSLIGFDRGIESSDLPPSSEDEMTTVSFEGLESTAVIEMLSSWDILTSIEAGTECMNIDVFGHPYIGVDLETANVVAFTNNDEYGEAGTEAENVAKEESNDAEVKGDGFFKKAGARLKNTGKWTQRKAKQFWKWLKSKIAILEPIMDRLAMMTSKSFDLSIIDEKKLGNDLSTIDRNLEKILVMVDENHEASFKSAEEYANIISNSKKKVSHTYTVSPIRLMGASDLWKKVRKVSKYVKKANDTKSEDAAKMVEIMTTTNKSIAAFNIQIKKALSVADFESKAKPNDEK